MLLPESMLSSSTLTPSLLTLTPSSLTPTLSSLVPTLSSLTTILSSSKPTVPSSMLTENPWWRTLHQSSVELALVWTLFFIVFLSVGGYSNGWGVFCSGYLCVSVIYLHKVSDHNSINVSLDVLVLVYNIKYFWWFSTLVGFIF